MDIKKQLPNGKEFTERARYIIDWNKKDNFISNVDNKSIIDRIYKRS